jgi:hypothetical protein
MRHENPDGTVFIFVLANFHSPDLEVFLKLNNIVGQYIVLGLNLGM